MARNKHGQPVSGQSEHASIALEDEDTPVVAEGDPPAEVPPESEPEGDGADEDVPVTPEPAPLVTRDKPAVHRAYLAPKLEMPEKLPRIGDAIWYWTVDLKRPCLAFIADVCIDNTTKAPDGRCNLFVVSHQGMPVPAARIGRPYSREPRPGHWTYRDVGY